MFIRPEVLTFGSWLCLDWRSLLWASSSCILWRRRSSWEVGIAIPDGWGWTIGWSRRVQLSWLFIWILLFLLTNEGPPSPFIKPPFAPPPCESAILCAARAFSGRDGLRHRISSHSFTWPLLKFCISNDNWWRSRQQVCSFKVGIERINHENYKSWELTVQIRCQNEWTKWRPFPNLDVWTKYTRA